MRTRGRPVAKLLAIPFARRFACRIASVSALVSVLVSALGPGSLSGILFACLSTSVLATPSGAAVTLQVSAAASLSNTMSEMKALFLLQNPGIGLALDFGSSGILQAQIEQGAPVDVFVSAGTRQMDALVAKGLVDSAEVRILARNTLVLVAPAIKGGFSREARLASIRTLEDLAEPELEHIAIGSERVVPAGLYAMQTLRQAGLLEKVKDKLVPGEDVRQVLAYVATGAAGAGFVYLTDALSEPRVRIVLRIPDDAHEPIVYPIAPLRQSDHADLAKRFVAFALGPDGRAILDKEHFPPPAGDSR